jgi:hypothetical protein
MYGFWAACLCLLLSTPGLAVEKLDAYPANPVAIIDFDGRQQADIATDYRITVDPNGSPISPFVTVVGRHGTVLTINPVDLDGDGDLDIVVTGHPFCALIRVWMNEGNRGFKDASLDDDSDSIWFRGCRLDALTFQTDDEPGYKIEYRAFVTSPSTRIRPPDSKKRVSLLSRALVPASLRLKTLQFQRAPPQFLH